MEPILFLKVYLDFSYYLCLCPFHLKFRKGKLYLESWWFQKWYWILFALVGQFWCIREIRDAIPTDMRNPSAYFRLVNSFFNTCGKWVILYSYLTKAEDYLKLLNLFCDLEKKFQKDITNICAFPVSLLRRKRVAYLYNAFNLTVALLAIVFGLGLDFYNDEDGNLAGENNYWGTWIRKLISTSRHVFFLDDSVSVVTLNYYDVKLWLLTTAGFFGFLHRRICGVYHDVLVSLIPISLWIPTKAFAELLKYSWRPSSEVNNHIDFNAVVIWRNVQSYYDTLKDLQNILNNIGGHLYTIFLILTVLYYSTGLDSLIIQKATDTHASMVDELSTFQHIQRMYFLLYFLCTTCSSLYCAGDICNQVEMK